MTKQISEAEIKACILRLLEKRQPGATICPSEAARALLKGVPPTNRLSTDNCSPGNNQSESTEIDPDNWRNLMQPVREAAQEMAGNGIIDITQKGQPVDPQHFKGPIRLRKKQH